MENKKKSIEQEFKDIYDDAIKRIKEQIDIAAKAVSEAEKISEETGIPFSARVSPLWNRYEPSTFKNKWRQCEEVEETEEGGFEAMLEELNVRGNSYCDGWEYSAVC